MILHQAYLHIFDKNSGNLLLSQKELPLSNPYITEYFTKIIEKTLKSDPRHGVLPPEEPLLGFLADDSIPFIEKHSNLLINYMKSSLQQKISLQLIMYSHQALMIKVEISLRFYV